MKNSKQFLFFFFLFLLVFTLRCASQIKVEFKNGNIFTVSKVAFTKYDVLIDLSPNIISKFEKLEIISIRYANGKKIDWSLMAPMISSDDEIKELGDISNLDIDYPPLKYEEKVEVPNIDKKKIYLRSRLWFHKNFVDDKAVLSIQDFENGILTGKGTFKVSVQDNTKSILSNEYLTGYVKFSIRIYMIDNKYKYVIDGFVHEDIYIKQGTTINAGMGLLTTNTQTPVNSIWVTTGESLLKKLKFYVDIRIKALTESLKNTVINDTESDF